MARLVVVAVLLVPLLGCARDRDAVRHTEPAARLTPLPPSPRPGSSAETQVAPAVAPAAPAAPVVVAEAEPTRVPHARHHHHRSPAPAPGSLQALLAANPQLGTQLSGLNASRFRSLRGPPVGPIVRPSPPLSGSAARANVLQLVVQNVPVFRHCYETALLADPHVSGRVVLHFTVATGGQPTGVRIEHGTGLDTVAVCISRRIQRWQFAPVDAPIPIDFPILLAP